MAATVARLQRSKLGSVGQPKTPILCYHKVGPITQEGRRLNIEPSRLDSHLKYFIRRDYAIVLPDWQLTAKYVADRKVCFTFDDAYSSAMENAMPVFESHGARCAFFAVTSLVGRTSEWDGPLARPLADWPALELAAKRGFLIGNHTHTHPHMTELDEPTQKDEIETAHQLLLDHGIHAVTFCYPYGSLNPTAVASVGKYYAWALALGKRVSTAADDPLAIPRVVVAYSDVLPKLLYKIHIRPLLPL
jgi:peptidoglycan/xylan/chitin deacetylase (PgdA/CDA1 family)